MKEINNGSKWLSVDIFAEKFYAYHFETHKIIFHCYAEIPNAETTPIVKEYKLQTSRHVKRDANQISLPGSQEQCPPPQQTTNTYLQYGSRQR